MFVLAVIGFVATMGVPAFLAAVAESIARAASARQGLGQSAHIRTRSGLG